MTLASTAGVGESVRVGPLHADVGDEFADFVRARQHQLLQAAHLVVGGEGEAEQLLREAFGVLCSRWHTLGDEDPDAVVLPYCLSGGTDNKALSLLGITGYGFAPLRLPADLDFAPMFHGVDERVPVDALRFGARVLGRLIATC